MTSSEGLPERARALLDAATGTHWGWNSYSMIFAGGVEREHPLNIADDDEPPCAVIAHITDNRVGGRGDQFRGPGAAAARANAEFIAEAPTLVAGLLAEMERRDQRDAYIADAVRLGDAAIEIAGVLPEGWRPVVIEHMAEISLIDQNDQGAARIDSFVGDGSGWSWTVWDDADDARVENGTADSPRAAALSAVSVTEGGEA